MLPFWRNASVKRKRVYSFLFVLLLSVVVWIAGSLVPLDNEVAGMLYDAASQIADGKTDSLVSLTGAIFTNNLRICLIMFIPLAGMAFGLFSMFSTGLAFSAISTVSAVSVGSLLLNTIIMPYFWLAFIAYALGMVGSIWLFRRLFQKRWHELKGTATFIITSVGLIALGAVVEAALILSMNV
jgi:hypothetical protein